MIDVGMKSVWKASFYTWASFDSINNYFINEKCLREEGNSQFLVFCPLLINKQIIGNNLMLITQKTKSCSRNQKICNLRRQIRKNPIFTTQKCNLQKKITQLQTPSPSQYEHHSQPKFAYENYKNFDSKYQTLQKIGEGANGLVNKCFHKIKKAHFAVKKLHYEEQQLRYIKDSFCFMKEISHNSIIKYHSMYLCPKVRKCLLVMEYFEHPSLSEFSSLEEQDIKKIAFQLISGISQLHQHFICHRDIKPENILYDQQQKVIKIIDFGISRRVRIRNKKKDLLTGTGTLYYKAPQMFLGTVYDQFVDEWAIGITLYKLVCGHTPFQSLYLMETIDNIQRGQVNFEDPVWNNYSKSMKDLISRFLRPRGERMSVEEAKKHVWFSAQIMAGESISEEIVDDSLIKKSTKSLGKLKRTITIKGDGKDIWKVENLSMNKSKKIIQGWIEEEKVVETGFESEDDSSAEN